MSPSTTLPPRSPRKTRSSRPFSKPSSTWPRSRSRCAQIAASLQQPTERVKDLLDQLIAEFDQPEHGVSIREVAGGYKMATKPEHHDAVRNFVKSLKPPLKLSLPALETLAVIAYKQPVTAPEIMEIRGVQGGGVLKTLLDRKLIAVAGRKNVIGKPILYKTTKEFLIQFGLKDLSELPSLKEFEEIRRMAFADSEAPPAPRIPAELPPESPRSGSSRGADARGTPSNRAAEPAPQPRKTSARRTSAEDPLPGRRRLAPPGREDHAGRPRHGERHGHHRTRHQGRSRTRPHQGGRQAAPRPRRTRSTSP